MIIHTKAHARAGLIGNPSDGYYGKTISLIIRNFSANVTLYQTPELEIIPQTQDRSCFQTIQELVNDVNLNGYYGGVRLIKATIKKFYDYCIKNGIELEDKNFTIRYNTNIPRQVGMAGSSAIITATLRALMAYYQVNIPKPIQPNLILSVETEELGITAGLQDRVIQVYEGLVYMDFNKEILDRQGYGYYEPLDPSLLPPLYVAYKTKLGKVSGTVHHSLRTRYESGDKQVIEAMKYFARLTDEVKACLLKGEKDKLPALLNANFDKRTEIINVGEENLELVRTARSCGASAKFAGSGGCIIGTYEDEAMYRKLKERLKELDAEVFKPIIEEV
ncbi:MAG: GHMP kinase [candidate division KSB1 bacterium]|nr:GHMP kinase [candidate division KSB1 bacterium]